MPVRLRRHAAAGFRFRAAGRLHAIRFRYDICQPSAERDTDLLFDIYAIVVFSLLRASPPAAACSDSRRRCFFMLRHRCHAAASFARLSITPCRCRFNSCFRREAAATPPPYAAAIAKSHALSGHVASAIMVAIFAIALSLSLLLIDFAVLAIFAITAPPQFSPLQVKYFRRHGTLQLLPPPAA